jgi:uncharacterized membrane protein YbhN (UPF0104 family)
LQPGQRLVSREGDLWRWDGFRAGAEDAPSAAALRLQQLNKLTQLKRDLEEVAARAEGAAQAHAALQARLADLARADQMARDARRAADALARHPLGWSRSMVALGLGVASHLALSATFAAAGAALSVDVSWGTLLSVGNAIVVAVLLPVSIGGIGVREGVAVALLSGAGVSTSEAVLVALTGYVTGQVPALLGGLLLVLERGPSKDLAPTRGEGAL